MIERFSVALSQAWVEAGIVDSGDESLYRYGLELLLSTAINIVLIAIISVAFGHPWAFLPYLISFMPLRSFAGGYHARTHWLCILVSAGLYTISLLFVVLMNLGENVVGCIVVGVAVVITTWVLAPVSSENKPLSAFERRRSRRISRGIAASLLAMDVIFAMARATAYLAVRMFVCGEVIAMVLLITEYVNTQNDKRKQREETM